MGIRRVEKLYAKILSRAGGADDLSINAGVREEIFSTIIDDLERLMRRIERCKPESLQYHDIDCEIRRLLLKEVQVIIDDYMLSKRNGTLVRWKKMYGEIEHYIADFYRFREVAGAQAVSRGQDRYGLYRDDST
jgi:hypothetical protein